jgi:fused signal recognition particle receptor
MNFLDKLKRGLARTAEQVVARLDDLGRRADTPDARGRVIDTDTAEQLEEMLMAADVGVTAAAEIVSAVRQRPRRGERLRDLVKQELLRVLDVPGPLAAAPRLPGTPEVVLVAGVNGVGKTTTIGKLANRMRLDGRAPLICAADTFRAAAVDQLQIWADRAGVDLIRARAGADPAAVVFDALAAARARQRDVVLVDTAGRLHTRPNLMGELEKIGRVAAREVPGAPHEVLLVLDATVGQNGLVQAREFTAAAGVTAIVLTKLDGTAKGGIAVAVAHDLGLPIRYVGVGEGIDDLLPFSPRDYVDAMFTEGW